MAAGSLVVLTGLPGTAGRTRAAPSSATVSSLARALRSLPPASTLTSIERALEALPHTSTLERIEQELAALPRTPTTSAVVNLVGSLPPTTVSAIERALPTVPKRASTSGRAGTSAQPPLVAVRPVAGPGSSSGSGAPTAPAQAAGARPRHIMVVMMENKNVSEVIGQSDQPFTNSLATRYGLATQSYAFGHPSLPNYLDIVSGSNQGVTDDNPPSSHRFPGAETLADQLAAAGITERAYAENLPTDPTNDSGEYAVRHVPWEYFPNARIGVADASTLIPDLSGPAAPAFVWYTPNLIHDEHDGTVQQGDAFLASLIPAVQATPWYAAGGAIVIEWDEADTDNAGINGGNGGHVVTIVVSAALKAHPLQYGGSVDTTGVLHAIEDAYGLAHLGGSAADGTMDPLLSPS
jgi:acid phosphatase